jgi:hypothetical protein
MAKTAHSNSNTKKEVAGVSPVVVACAVVIPALVLVLGSLFVVKMVQLPSHLLDKLKGVQQKHKDPEKVLVDPEFRSASNDVAAWYFRYNPMIPRDLKFVGLALTNVPTLIEAGRAFRRLEDAGVNGQCRKVYLLNQILHDRERKTWGEGFSQLRTRLSEIQPGEEFELLFPVILTSADILEWHAITVLIQGKRVNDRAALRERLTFTRACLIEPNTHPSERILSDILGRVMEIVYETNMNNEIQNVMRRIPRKLFFVDQRENTCAWITTVFILMRLRCASRVAPEEDADLLARAVANKRLGDEMTKFMFMLHEAASDSRKIDDLAQRFRDLIKWIRFE